MVGTKFVMVSTKFVIVGTKFVIVRVSEPLVRLGFQPPKTSKNKIKQDKTIYCKTHKRGV
jgi:hypothetical protein